MTSDNKRNESTANSDTTGILLVEDHTSFRQALAFRLEIESDLAVVAQAGTLAEARETLKRTEGIEIAVVDLVLPDGSGVSLIQELSDRDVAVLVLSASVDRAELARAVEAGAAGVLHKAASVNEIANAVRRLRAGEALLAPNEVIEMLRMASREREKSREAKLTFEKLTPRELEVLEALAEGLDSREIAEKLHITVETERTHMVNILNKFGARSRLQALVLAARNSLVEIR